MVTWNEADPPRLPQSNGFIRAVAWVRISLLIGATALAAGLYLLARFLERPFGVRCVREAVQTGWCVVATTLLGLRVRRIGEPMKRNGAIMSNHITWIDIPVIRASAPVYFVAKAEVSAMPGAGWIATITDTVFVERKRTAAKQQEQELLTRLARGDQLCIFPEGTSTDGLRVLPFKSTLFAIFFNDALADADGVQPISVVYQPNPRSGLPKEFYGWWGDMSFGGNIKDMARLSWGGQATVVFHEPVRARDFKSRKELAEHCTNAVSEGLHAVLDGREVIPVPAPPSFLEELEEEQATRSH